MRGSKKGPAGTRTLPLAAPRVCFYSLSSIWSDRPGGVGDLTPDMLPGNNRNAPPPTPTGALRLGEECFTDLGQVATVGMPALPPILAFPDNSTGGFHGPLVSQWASPGLLTPTPCLVRQLLNSQPVCPSMTQTALLPG